jgi:hypothetical protein
MQDHKVLEYKKVLFLAIALALALGCGLSTPTPSPTPKPPALKQSPLVKASVVVADPAPKVTGSVHPPLPVEFMFLESDCPTQAFTGLTAKYGPGALNCRYHWDGKFGANNVELTIMQYTDPEKFKIVITSDIVYRQKAVASQKATQAAGSNKKNDHTDVIQDDSDGAIYMETYDGYATTDNPDIPLCGNGMGTVGVNGQFVVTLMVSESCDISTSASDYSKVMIALRDAALAAIGRQESNNVP